MSRPTLVAAEARPRGELDFFRELLGDRDLSQELDLVLKVLEHTPFAELIAPSPSAAEESF